MDKSIHFLALMIVQVLAWNGTSLAGTLQVQGSGRVVVAPDVASTFIGVRSRAKEADKAQVANAEAIQRMLAAIENLGIPKDDLHTSNYQFRRDARNDAEGNLVELGYYVEMTVLVKVRNFDILGKLVATAAANGATNIQDYEFSVADAQPLVEKARLLAFENARHEANKNAAAANVTLLGISSIANGYATLPGLGRDFCTACADMPANGGVKSLEPEIRPGTVAVGYDVTVTYDIK